jgi:hypothetical protein
LAQAETKLVYLDENWSFYLYRAVFTAEMDAKPALGDEPRLG